MFNTNKSARSGLKIIIVGCGKVGRTLVEQLSKEGHNITLIDQKSSAIEQLTNMYDVMGVEGNGASYSVQKEAGIEDSDLIISVTNSDELNLLCCTIATQVANCAAIARVRNPDYNKEVGYIQEKLGLAMIINPEYEAATEIANILSLPNSLEVNSFAHGQTELIKFQIPEGSKLDNRSLIELSNTFSGNVLIGAVERDGEVYIPSGSFVLKTGDTVSFVATKKRAREFFKNNGLSNKQVKNTLIVGGGRAAFYLAEQLINSGINVKIIEENREHCEKLSILLPKAIIINGDGTDKELLMEEGLDEIDAFVPLTGIDEENIMLTLYAKKVSNAKVITKINKINFTEVINSLDLGSVVYPKYITSEAIIAYVRAKTASLNSNIETLYHMYDSRVEAIEFLIREESKLTNIPLKDLTLKDNLLIPYINRNGSIIVPSGQDCIKVNDTVMIITTHTGIGDVLDILK